MNDAAPQSPRHAFPPRMRLRSSRQFLPLYRSAARINIGPLTMYGKPNDLPHPRLGLSVSRRVGKSVVRNRIKRLLREAFRLGQHDWPRGYDVVINVRAHEPLSLEEYAQALAQARATLHQTWLKKTNTPAKSNRSE